MERYAKLALNRHLALALLLQPLSSRIGFQLDPGFNDLGGGGPDGFGGSGTSSRIFRLGLACRRTVARGIRPSERTVDLGAASTSHLGTRRSRFGRRKAPTAAAGVSKWLHDATI